VSDSAFYTDRTGQRVPRDSEEITAYVWGGLVALIQRCIGDGSMARDFPIYHYEDGAGYVTGTDEVMFLDSLNAQVPQAGDRPLDTSQLPDTSVSRTRQV
jgi:hypothetical protein